MRHLGLIAMLFCNSVPVLAQETLQPCTASMIKAAEINLPDEIAFDPDEATVVLSKAYGCEYKVDLGDGLDVDYQAVHVDKMDEGARPSDGYLASESLGLIYATRKLKNGPTVAVEVLDSRAVKASAHPQDGAPVLRGASASPSDDFMNVQSRLAAVLRRNETDTSLKLSEVANFFEVARPERLVVTFESKPSGAEIWRDDTYKGNTRKGIDMRSGLLEHYRFVMSGFQDCPFSGSTLLPTGRVEQYRMFCALAKTE